MKWFISCLIIIYIGLSLSFGLITGFVITVVTDSIEEDNRASLIAHYNIEEE